MSEILLTVNKLAIPTFLLSSMFGMGLSLTLHQIIALLRNARLVIVAVVPNFIVVPLLAVGINYGKQAFAAVYQPVCYYWIHETERKAKVRKGTVDGMPVREYFRIRYGADPQ